jgi:hypothetical protein
LTTDAIAAIVERFEATGPMDAAGQVERGDELCASAEGGTRGKKLALQLKPADRLALQLEAAEWYVRAKNQSKGLYRRLVELNFRRFSDGF